MYRIRVELCSLTLYIKNIFRLNIAPVVTGPAGLVPTSLVYLPWLIDEQKMLLNIQALQGNIDTGLLAAISLQAGQCH